MQQDDYDRWIAPVQSRMVSCVWRIVRDPADAQDVLQDVLVLVLKRFRRIRRHPNPTALLLRMCINQSLDHLRRRRSRQAMLDRLPGDPRPAPPSPAGRLAQVEDRERLLAFIGTLPPREAEAITLHVVEELDYPAVAEAMGCSLSTVRVHVGRARERFRDAFGAAARREPADDAPPKPELQPD